MGQIHTKTTLSEAKGMQVPPRETWHHQAEMPTRHRTGDGDCFGFKAHQQHLPKAQAGHRSGTGPASSPRVFWDGSGLETEGNGEESSGTAAVPLPCAAGKETGKG